MLQPNQFRVNTFLGPKQLGAALGAAGAVGLAAAAVSTRAGRRGTLGCHCVAVVGSCPLLVHVQTSIQMEVKILSFLHRFCMATRTPVTPASAQSDHLQVATVVPSVH